MRDCQLPVVENDMPSLVQTKDPRCTSTRLNLPERLVSGSFLLIDSIGLHDEVDRRAFADLCTAGSQLYLRQQRQRSSTHPHLCEGLLALDDDTSVDELLVLWANAFETLDGSLELVDLVSTLDVEQNGATACDK